MALIGVLISSNAHLGTKQETYFFKKNNRRFFSSKLRQILIPKQEPLSIHTPSLFSIYFRVNLNESSVKEELSSYMMFVKRSYR